MNNENKNSIRLDQYLFFVRFFKSRNLASKFVLNGKLRIEGTIVKKPHKSVCINDVLTIEKNDQIKIIKILKLPIRRGPFLEAKDCYEDQTPNLDIKQKRQNFFHSFISRVGRPTKMDRRKIDKLMGRN